jgi:hypothetical protein
MEYPVFDTMEVAIDAYGRPVFILPIDLRKDAQCSVVVKEKNVEIFADQKMIGDVGIDAPSILDLVALQKEMGLIAWDESKTPQCPDRLTHVAKVSDHSAVKPSATIKRQSSRFTGPV